MSTVRMRRVPGNKGMSLRWRLPAVALPLCLLLLSSRAEGQAFVADLFKIAQAQGAFDSFLQPFQPTPPTEPSTSHDTQILEDAIKLRSIMFRPEIDGLGLVSEKWIKWSILFRNYEESSEIESWGNPYGAEYAVPMGKYRGDHLIGVTQERRRGSASDYIAWRRFENGRYGLGSATSGWNFEPGGALVRRWDLDSYDVSYTPPTETGGGYYTVRCSVVPRFRFLSTSDGYEFVQKGPIQETQLCRYFEYNYTNLDDHSYLKPNDCHQRAVSQCLHDGLVPTEFWSTEGQVRLDVPRSSWWQSEGETAWITKPDGTVITLEPAGDASGALYWFNSGPTSMFQGDPNRPDVAWRPVTETDRNGNITRWQYQPGSTLLTDPRGRTTTFVRNGRITEIRKPGPAGQELTWKLQWTELTWNPVDVFPGLSCSFFDSYLGPDYYECTPRCLNYPCTEPRTLRDHTYTTLTKLTLPDGRFYEFSYKLDPLNPGSPNGYGNLTMVKTPDGGVTIFKYATPGTPTHEPYSWTASHPFSGVGWTPNGLLESWVRERIDYPNGLAGDGHSTRYEHELPAQVLPPGSGCASIKWTKAIHPDGTAVRLGMCGVAGSGGTADVLAERVLAEQTLDPYGNIVAATYRGQTGHVPDGTRLGISYLTHESESPRTVPPLDPRPTKVVHYREGVWTSEVFEYEASSTRRALGNRPRTNGNVQRVRLLSGPGPAPGGWVDESSVLRETVTSYLHSPEYDAKNLLRLPWSVEVLAHGSVVERTMSAYDEGDEPADAPGATNLDVSVGRFRGNVTSVWKWVNDSETVTAGSRYYKTGDIASVTDSRGVATTTQMDFSPCASTLTPIRTSVTNILGHTASTVTDCHTGAVLSVTDANRNKTCTQYDSLGRIVAVAGPGDSLPSDPSLVKDPDCSGGAGGPQTWTDYPPLAQNGPQWSVVHAKDGTPDGHQRKTFLDGVGRTIQSCTEVDASIQGHGWVCDRIAYDAMGRPWQGFVPFHGDNVGTTPIGVPAGTQYTRTTYDALGRVTSRDLVGPEGQSFDRTQTSYGVTSYSALDGSWGTGFLTTVTDANNHVSKTIVNLLGHVVETQRQWGGCPDEFCVTKVLPDALGRVGMIRDPRGNPTTIFYDWLGRKLEMNDPDMGAWRYEYDPNGNLTKQTDAKGQVVRMQYDPLNRLTLQDLPPAGPGAEDVVNTYDGVVPSTCYSCNDRCATTVDSCDETTKTCRHVGEPCDVPCIEPKTCSSPGVTCGTNIPDGCGGTISCCYGSGCTPVTCTGCQTLNACGDGCNNLPAGVEGNCAACQDCDGNGNCGFVANGAQDVGCEAGATACSWADTCNGAGACVANDLPAGAEGACPTCQDCDGSGNCGFVASGQQDVGCDAPANSCSAADVCNGWGSCNLGDTDRLTSEQGIWSEQSVTSCDGRFRLLMQGAGNLVLYGPHGAMWATPTVGTGANHALMQSDGNFVLYNSYAAVWTSNTWRYPGAWLIVQNDGNVVIYTAWGYPVWATNTRLYCGDGYCDEPETLSSCALDCSYCGDGSCTGSENIETCATDCYTGYCGDGSCDRPVEDEFSCQPDCGYPILQ